MKLLLAEAAERDFESAEDWLTRPGSGLRAQRKLSALIIAVSNLIIDGRRWPIYLPAGNPRIRKRSIEGFTIIYEIVEPVPTDSGEDIFIHAIYGPGQFRG
ncbi:MAG: hypothetical protein FJX59_00985 [Alphaproteobacteria bacterium]|nr:hypothetical protein [Alphaproteobacteria bacterium]